MREIDLCWEEWLTVFCRGSKDVSFNNLYASYHTTINNKRGLGEYAICSKFGNLRNKY